MNSEKNPKIKVSNKGDRWEIEVSKDEKYLKMNLFDRDQVPEFEIIEFKR